MMARSVKLFYERVFMESFVESAGVLLDNKQRMNTAIDPELEDLMREAGRIAADILHARYPNAVPQADGDSGDSPTWIGEIDGKRYTGLRTQETVISLTDEFGKKGYGLGNVEILKSGNLSHLPEGSH